MSTASLGDLLTANTLPLNTHTRVKMELKRPPPPPPPLQGEDGARRPQPTAKGAAVPPEAFFWVEIGKKCTFLLQLPLPADVFLA